MRTLLICMMGIAPLLLYAQAVPPLPGMHHATLPLASRHQTDIFSAGFNPALLTFLNASTAGTFTEQRFGVPGLFVSGLGVAHPAKAQIFALQLHRAGGPEAYQMAGAFATARKLGAQLSLGIALHYQATAVSGYGSAGAMGFAAGLCAQLAPKVSGFAGVENLHRPAFGAPTERLAARVHLGIGTDLSEGLALGALLLKTEGQPAQCLATVQYQFAPKLRCRASAGTGAAPFSFGGGVLLGKCRLDVFTAVHPQLGFSPGLQFLWSLNPRS